MATWLFPVVLKMNMVMDSGPRLYTCPYENGVFYATSQNCLIYYRCVNHMLWSGVCFPWQRFDIGSFSCKRYSEVDCNPEYAGIWKPIYGEDDDGAIEEKPDNVEESGEVEPGSMVEGDDKDDNGTIEDGFHNEGQNERVVPERVNVSEDVVNGDKTIKETPDFVKQSEKVVPEREDEGDNIENGDGYIEEIPVEIEESEQVTQSVGSAMDKSDDADNCNLLSTQEEEVNIKCEKDELEAVHENKSHDSESGETTDTVVQQETGEKMEDTVEELLKTENVDILDNELTQGLDYLKDENNMVISEKTTATTEFDIVTNTITTAVETNKMKFGIFGPKDDISDLTGTGTGSTKLKNKRFTLKESEKIENSVSSSTTEYAKQQDSSGWYWFWCGSGRYVYTQSQEDQNNICQQLQDPEFVQEEGIVSPNSEWAGHSFLGSQVNPI